MLDTLADQSPACRLKDVEKQYAAAARIKNNRF